MGAGLCRVGGVQSLIVEDVFHAVPGELLIKAPLKPLSKMGSTSVRTCPSASRDGRWVRQPLTIPEELDTQTGRPGMALWDILVLGSLRVDLYCDYDRVVELANEHRTLRLMLGHGLVDEAGQYRLQTTKDNLRLFTPNVLKGINQIVVKAGHRGLGAGEGPLAGRCDSFVVEADLDYPTDIKLLVDAIRTVVRLCGRLYHVRSAHIRIEPV